MNAITFENLWEEYHIKFVVSGKVSWEEIWALQDVSFAVEKGEVLGIIGQNGAGKTTLLRLIAGMLIPDKGKINVSGRVTALMALGAGFDLEFTGRENVVLNARAYGVSEESLEKKIEGIIEFSGLGKLIDAPIKYYSQGMYMRLAFALAIFSDPDIFLIDDILAVGDEEAQQKCTKKIFELKELGKTIVVVSHDMSMVSRLCNRVILLEKGKIIKAGPPQLVIPYYVETSGNRRGIRVLESASTRVVFNNGRLFLNYGGAMLSGSTGSYGVTSSHKSQIRLSSVNLNWDVQNPERGSVTALGKTGDGQLSQVLKVGLDGGKVDCRLEVAGEDANESYMDLPFVSQYSKCLTFDQETVFPSFFHRTDWHEVEVKALDSGVLGLIPSEERPDLPYITIKVEESDGLLKVFNSGYGLEARIVQVLFRSQEGGAISFNLLKTRDEFNEFFQQLKAEHAVRGARQKELLLIAPRIEILPMENAPGFGCSREEPKEDVFSEHGISSGDIRLFADSERKAVRLYYKGREITKHSGIYSSFLINNKRHDLSSSEFEVHKANEKLILKLTWEDLDFVQDWELFLQGDRLFWKADSFTPATARIEELKFGILLQPEYQKLFCGKQQQAFPMQSSAWQEIALDNPHAEFFGLRGQGDLPAIVFKNEEGNSNIILNSDLNSSCRGLLLSLPKMKIKNRDLGFASTMDFSEGNRFVEACLNAEAAQFVSRQSISSGPIRVFFDLEQKAIRLYHGNWELSGPQGGICTSLPLKDAELAICKISEKQMRLTLNYGPTQNSFQIWDFSFVEEDALEIVMTIEATGELSLKECSFRLEVKDVYEQWMTGCEQGDFRSQIQKQDTSVIRLKENKVPKVVLKSGPSAPLSSLAFEVCQYAGQFVLRLFRATDDGKNSYVSVQYAKIIPYKAASLPPGRHCYFHGKILFNNEKFLKRAGGSGCHHGVQNGKLEVVFSNGKSAIYFDKKELTLGLGIYTSLRSSGFWYDSYQAVWELVSKTDKQLIVLGHWPYFPISQTWEIALKGEREFSWKVDMEVHDRFALELEQSNLMLSSDYKNWKAADMTQGLFMDEYTTQYNILPFRFWSGRAAEIEASKNCLPGIKFRNSVGKASLRGVIENTDVLYRARLLLSLIHI